MRIGPALQGETYFAMSHLDVDKQYLPTISLIYLTVILNVAENVNQPQETQPIQTPAKKPLWKRVLRYFFISTGIFLGVVILAAILIPLLFENQIKRIFINELNKNLATAVVVDEKDIDLTILKNFPDASVVFHNIGIAESVPRSDKQFLHAGEISLVFNIMNLLKGNYVIEKIIVEDGYCNLITDKKGNINYKFWKESEDTSSANFSIDLQKVECNKMDFNYRDYKHQIDIAFAIHHADFNGNFSADNYKMLVAADLLSKHINISGASYLKNKETNIESSLLVDVKEDKYSFQKGNISVDKNKFLVDGYIALKDKNYYDLIINGDKINMEALFLLLPGDVSNKLSGIQSSGDLNFETKIKGFSTSTETPRIDINFAIGKGTVQHEKFGDKLTDVSFKGSYTNGEKHTAQTSSIQIQDFTCRQNNEPINFQLSYVNFTNPVINLKLNGNVPASLIVPFAVKDATDVEGMIGLKNININGNIKSLSSDLATNQPTGEIEFNNLSFKSNGESVALRSGKAIVQNNEIQFDNLLANLGGSDVVLNLVVTNWIQSVFPSEFQTALNINGTLISEQIDLNKLLATFSSPEEIESKEEEIKIISPEEVNNTMLNFSGVITTTVNSLTYNKLEFKNIKTTLNLSPGMIVLDKLSCNAMGGTCEINASFRELSNGTLILETNGTIQQINITDLFDQFNNFGQTTLTSKNLKGKLSANIYELTAMWDKDYQLIESSIYNRTNMKIENGELMDYKPLESLSGFVDLKDLKHIIFSTFVNEIEIKDRMIIIPAMKIETSALDLYMSGKHSFDNAIDYQFKLSMADVLVKKFLGGNKKREDYEENKEGGVNAYISMTGTVSNPIIKYNKKEAKQKLEESGLEQTKFIDIFKADPDDKLFKHPDKKQETPVDTNTIEFIEFDEEQ